MLDERLDAYRREGIESILAAPLTISGRGSGTVVFYFQTPHEFSDVEQSRRGCDFDGGAVRRAAHQPRAGRALEAAIGVSRGSERCAGELARLRSDAADGGEARRAEDSERSLSSGFQAHVTKPIDSERLLSTIADLAGRTPSAA